MNTPTGTPADPRTAQGSNKPTRPPVRLLSRQQEQRSQVWMAERAAACRAGSGLASAWNRYSGNRRHHDDPVGRRLNPPEKDPS